MKVNVFKNKGEAAEEVADVICDLVKRKPNCVLGLAAGETMIPIYAELVRRYKKKEINFSKVRTFNLDEYCGLNARDVGSFRKFMDINFFNRVNLKKENISFLDGRVKEVDEECLRYESMIKKCGGIDLQLLGIGMSGHIGFNEPGSSFESLTRKVELREETRRVNSRFFGSMSQMPKYALTMGIATIFNARKIILVAFGDEKSEIICRLISERVGVDLPASILKKHTQSFIFLDKDAAHVVKTRASKSP